MPVSPNYVRKTNSVCGHLDRPHRANGLCNACHCHERYIACPPKPPRRLSHDDVVRMVGECRHANPKQSGTAKCENCYRAAYKRLPDIKERNNSLGAARHKADPERKRADQKRYYKRTSKRHAQRVYGYILKMRYKLTTDEYERILSDQGGVCAICRSDTPGGKRVNFSVDHDHNCCPGTVAGSACADFYAPIAI